MQTNLRLLEGHANELRKLVLACSETEGAAYMLCGSARIATDPWDGGPRRVVISHAVVEVPAGDKISSSAVHVTWSTASFVKLLRRAKDEGFLPTVVHSHPNGPAEFSTQDDKNEAELFRLAKNRNGHAAELLSIIITGAGEMVARLWSGDGQPVPIVDITEVGQRLRIVGRNAVADDAILSRQMLALGPDVNRILKNLKIGIVGLSGTGSPATVLVTRLGAGRLALIEKDVIDFSNLNRVHGSRRADAEAKMPKAQMLAREVAAMDLGTIVATFEHWVSDPGCRDALKSCDVILGCTDDHDGRLLLNRFAYFYAIPVIDMGLAIDPRPEGGMRDMSGRVSVVLPGAPCLLCRGIVDPVQARDDDLRRRSPQEYERRQREGYVRGSQALAPAVITFTTETACMAVNELLQGLVDFRGTGGWVWQRRRRFDLCEDRRPGSKADSDCPICSTTEMWGRGDVEPFLDRVG
jgi:molybdopterin/thiamine biosynthesis adenylyltransferase